MFVDRCLCCRHQRLVCHDWLSQATLKLLDAYIVYCCGVLRDVSADVCTAAHGLSSVLHGRLLPLQRFQLAALLASGLARSGSRQSTCPKSIQVMDKWELCPWLHVSRTCSLDSLTAIEKVHWHVCTCRRGLIYSLSGCLYTSCAKCGTTCRTT